MLYRQLNVAKISFLVGLPIDADFLRKLEKLENKQILSFVAETLEYRILCRLICGDWFSSFSCLDLLIK